MNRDVAVPAGKPATLCRLRNAVAKIEGQETSLAIGVRPLAFGIDAIDAVLRGGLAPASLHEVAPSAWRDTGAAIGFVSALAARLAGKGGDTLWIATDFAAREAGELYGPGCESFGLPTKRLLIVKAPRPLDVLWTMEEALKCRALSSVVAELPDDGALADLNATRRLTVAARDGGGFGFLLRHHRSPLASAAETRWDIAAVRSRADRFGGLGCAIVTANLLKNRHGPTGQWTIAWDHHECIFSTLSLGVAQAAFGRPDRTPLVRAG